MAKREIDVHVPAYAVEVPGGYPLHVLENTGWDLTAHIYVPAMPSPRPRVTSRGTFMPHDYRQHCDRLACSLAYARGVLESHGRDWNPNAPMRLDLAFWAPKQTGDLDNLAKTVMDAGQLHRGEEPGAELWTNDRQIRSLVVDWIPTDEPEWHQLVVRVRALTDNQARAGAEPGQGGAIERPGNPSGLDGPKSVRRPVKAQQKAKTKKGSKS